MARRRCLDWPADGCEQFTEEGSRCQPCRRRRWRERAADRKTAAELVADHPSCQCTDTAHGHGDPCGSTDRPRADHVLPLAHGHGHRGPRQVLCEPCNIAKGSGRYGPTHVYGAR